MEDIVNFFKSIDPKLLRDQKYDILENMDDLKKQIEYATKAQDEPEAYKLTEQKKSLQGIIEIIDKIQGILVGSFGAKESETLLTVKE